MTLNALVVCVDRSLILIIQERQEINHMFNVRGVDLQNVVSQKGWMKNATTQHTVFPEEGLQCGFLQQLAHLSQADGINQAAKNGIVAAVSQAMLQACTIWSPGQKHRHGRASCQHSNLPVKRAHMSQCDLVHTGVADTGVQWHQDFQQKACERLWLAPHCWMRRLQVKNQVSWPHVGSSTLGTMKRHPHPEHWIRKERLHVTCLKQGRPMFCNGQQIGRSMRVELLTEAHRHVLPYGSNVGKATGTMTACCVFAHEVAFRLPVKEGKAMHWGQVPMKILDGVGSKSTDLTTQSCFWRHVCVAILWRHVQVQHGHLSEDRACMRVPKALCAVPAWGVAGIAFAQLRRFSEGVTHPFVVVNAQMTVQILWSVEVKVTNNTLGGEGLTSWSKIYQAIPIPLDHRSDELIAIGFGLQDGCESLVHSQNTLFLLLAE